MPKQLTITNDGEEPVSVICGLQNALQLPYTLESGESDQFVFDGDLTITDAEEFQEVG